MGKVILFEKSNYDITGTYWSYDTDRFSENYALLYDDPTNPLEVNSIMIIDTDYRVTLIYVRDDNVIVYMHVNTIPDIKNAVVTKYTIETKFTKIFLIPRDMKVNENRVMYHRIREDEPFNFPNEQYDNYIHLFKSNKDNELIQENIKNMDSTAQCKIRTERLQKDFVTLEDVMEKCNEENSHKNDYETIIIKLNERIKELRAENSVRSTTSEYFLGTLIFVGFVMFLYAVYISLYSSSLF